MAQLKRVDENAPGKRPFAPRIDGRRFGKDIANIITNQQSFLQNILPTKQSKRPISVQRQSSLNNQNRRCNVSQDDIDNQSTLVNTPLIPTKAVEMEIEVEDISLQSNKKDVQMVEPYLQDIFSFIRQKEREQKVNSNFLQTQEEINSKMRAILVDWLIDVHNRFRLVPETLFLAISITDTYLQKKQIARNKLQLLGITSLFMSSKYCDIYPPQLNYFSEVTDKTYTKQEILEMEGKVLQELQFDLTNTSSLTFFERYSQISQLDDKCYNLCRYLLELVMLDSRFSKYCASMQASSAIYLSQKIYKKKVTWSNQLEGQSGFTEQMVRPCAKEMCQLLQQASNMSLQAAQRKFSSSQFMEISKIHISYKK